MNLVPLRNAACVMMFSVFVIAAQGECQRHADCTVVLNTCSCPMAVETKHKDDKKYISSISTCLKSCPSRPLNPAIKAQCVNQECVLDLRALNVASCDSERSGSRIASWPSARKLP